MVPFLHPGRHCLSPCLVPGQVLGTVVSIETASIESCPHGAHSLVGKTYQYMGNPGWSGLSWRTQRCCGSLVQSLSRVWLFATPWTTACWFALSIANSRRLLKLMSIESVVPSNNLILCSFLLLSSIFPSIRVFSNESVLHIRWPKYWSFSVSPSNEYSRLISSRIDWFDLLAVQGTLKRLLQHHSSKASILRYSALFMVQLAHPYMTTGKTIVLTRRTFVGKVISLLFFFFLQ